MKDLLTLYEDISFFEVPGKHLEDYRSSNIVIDKFKFRYRWVRYYEEKGISGFKIYINKQQTKWELLHYDKFYRMVHLYDINLNLLEKECKLVQSEIKLICI